MQYKKPFWRNTLILCRSFSDGLPYRRRVMASTCSDGVLRQQRDLVVAEGNAWGRLIAGEIPRWVNLRTGARCDVAQQTCERDDGELSRRAF